MLQGGHREVRRLLRDVPAGAPLFPRGADDLALTAPDTTHTAVSSAAITPPMTAAVQRAGATCPSAARSLRAMNVVATSGRMAATMARARVQRKRSRPGPWRRTAPMTRPPRPREPPGSGSGSPGLAQDGGGVHGEGQSGTRTRPRTPAWSRRASRGSAPAARSGPATGIRSAPRSHAGPRWGTRPARNRTRGPLPGRAGEQAGLRDLHALGRVDLEVEAGRVLGRGYREPYPGRGEAQRRSTRPWAARPRACRPVGTGLRLSRSRAGGSARPAARRSRTSTCAAERAGRDHHPQHEVVRHAVEHGPEDVARSARPRTAGPPCQVFRDPYAAVRPPGHR